VAVRDLPGFVTQLATNYSHSCALLVDGSVWCWGSNQFGQLGNGTTTNALVPIPVGGIPAPVVAIATGSQHSCAVTEDDTVYCWGLNAYGQLGDGTQTQQLSPVQVVGLDDNVVQLTLGDWTSCARTADGTAQCWGRNDGGHLGTGATSPFEAMPQAVSFAGTIVDIDASREGACFVTDPGEVYCMGRNNYGQMGTGVSSPGAFPVPQLVSGTSDIVQVSYGSRHVCARAEDGPVSCWGRNDAGQLGLGMADGAVHSAASVNLGEPIWQLSAGAAFNCGLTLDGGVLCWGSNSVGQIGNDQLGVDQLEPVAVLGGTFALPQADAVARLTIGFYPGRDRSLRASFETDRGRRRGH
jgi:alpha-tubulin suppressor-like RCC1 family protein